MAKKLMAWKTKGMNQDLSVSAFNPEFAFKNMNLRLSTNEKNTLMSWVTEKGTSEIILKDEELPSSDYEIKGTPVGTAVLNKYLILFTHKEGDSSADPPIRTKDFIYRLYFSGSTTMKCKELYNGDLNLSPAYPLETLVSYEAEHIQKVYWTDGRNQPRMINIAPANENQLNAWTTNGNTTCFDFVSSFTFGGTLEIEKLDSGGLFAPGVIQYCFCYLNKYGQQSNVVAVSPLYYLSYNDRAASPEEKVSNSFKIIIPATIPGSNDYNLDSNFEYIRLYSIQRTSLNLEPVVKLLEDIKYDTGGDIVYTDNGTVGSLVDPTELLFVGGREITALTMIDKDNTLFLGNVAETNASVEDIQDYFDSIRSDANIITYRQGKSFEMDHTTGIYSHTNTLNKTSNEITTFKGGETYRFGFQLQKKTGEWTEPIFIEDKYNDYYPQTSVFTDTINLVDASATINFSNLPGYDSGRYDSFIGIRPVIVYPNPTDRNVLCQGVLNPTVFNVKDRKTSSPFAQASWYFRPFMVSGQELPDIPTPVAPSITSDDIGSQSVDPDPAFAGRVHEIYIIVATLKGNLDMVIYNNRIHYGIIINGQWAETRSAEVEGVIKISDNNNKYAFVLKEPISDGTTSFQWANSVSYDGQTYKLYNSMYTDNYELKYPGDGTNTTYTFKFRDTSKFYSVLYRAIAKNDYSNINISSNSSHAGFGIGVDFLHYASLYTQGEEDKNQQHTENQYKIEIQGSARTYTNVAGESSSSDTDVVGDNSNTQFFVDQSIVTLNSPDIEFDTDVQVADTSNLKLRIVGAIPITANASAHKVSISSNMLETSKTFKRELPFTRHIINVDTGVDTSFGSGELDVNVLYKNINLSAGNKLVADYLWEDVIVDNSDTDNVQALATKAFYLIHPWHRSGSLNNDSRPNDSVSSLLKTKKESNTLFSINSEYFPESNQTTSYKNYDSIGCQMVLTENAQVMNYRLPKQLNSSDVTSAINYYPNIDKILYNNSDNGYRPIKMLHNSGSQPETYTDSAVFTPVSMKYKSTSHAVIALNSTDDTTIPILPKGDAGAYAPAGTNPLTSITTFWGDTIVNSQKDFSTYIGELFNCPNVATDSHVKFNYLWLGELYRDVDSSAKFGGSSKEAVKNNTWCVAGETKPFNEETEEVTLEWTVGDTYYQRYDCLKTYPFTNEDPNQLVEILSFMCETHVNIDGRYDRNRGQIDNTNMSPINFNLLNPVYSQRDNFFIGKKTGTDAADSLTYPNQIYYSKTKTSGADVDAWTNVTLASMLELDGDKGSVNKLAKLNDNIIAFQDTGISQILYNENVQIASTAGVPIEIANSGKVQGKRYISDSIGCGNKWSVVNTPSGIYFMDNNSKGIYLFNGQLTNLSEKAGFSTWSHQHIFSKDIKWRPDTFGFNSMIGKDAFVSYYDKTNQEVLFIHKENALAFSEKIGTFTSFYDYGSIPYFCNIEDNGVWINNPFSDITPCTLWKHQAGEYCRFFGENKPYWMTLVGNPEPQMDKIFTNLEFRACVDGDGTTETNDGVTTFKTFYKPFDSLEAWNEYQHGIAALDIKNGHDMALHHLPNSNDASLIRKFRIWRCDIPRDNAAIPDLLGLPRFKRRPMDRMRNPWVYMKLMKNAAQDIQPEQPGGDVTVVTLPKAEIHDVLMTYFE